MRQTDAWTMLDSIIDVIGTDETLEALARAIDEGGQPWETRKKLKRELITEFIEEVTK